MIKNFFKGIFLIIGLCLILKDCGLLESPKVEPPPPPPPPIEDKSAWPDTGNRGPTRAEESGVATIVGLANRGLLKFFPEAPDAFLVQIEPLIWKNSLHRDKVRLVQAAMNMAHFLNWKMGRHYNTIIFSDLTSGERLAVGWIEGGVSPGQIKIEK